MSGCEELQNGELAVKLFIKRGPVKGTWQNLSVEKS